MTDSEKLKHKLWTEMQSQMTVMLQLAGSDAVDPRPMTAIPDEKGEEHGPLWFFTATDTSLSRALSGPVPAVATFTAKGQDLFATIRGTLTRSDDRQVIDRLWNPFVAAWYPEGREDPTLTLLRMDLHEAEIWETGSSIVTGVKALMGADLRRDMQDKAAEVRL
ncbi:MAG: pyridoxamine 5'-phosphate oxidase family protein [Tranquillimonas sp.]